MVTARGKTFEKESRYQRGGSFFARSGINIPRQIESARMTYEAMVKKFTGNASRVLPSKKIDRAVELIFGLDKVANVADLMDTLKLG